MQSTLKWICLIALCINVFYVTIGVVKYGSQHIDAYGIWMLKTKGFVIEQGIPTRLLHDPQYAYSHQQYPLLLPFLLSVLWQHINILYPLGYVGVLIGIYKLLRQDNHSELEALVWTAAASFLSPLIAAGGRLHAGLADIWICLLCGLALWISKSLALSFSLKKAIALVVTIAIASQIKQEGIFLLFFLITLPIVRTKKIMLVTLALLPFLWWQWQIRVLGLPSDFGFTLHSIGEILMRIQLILLLIVKEMGNINNWYLVWPIFWLSLIGWREKRRWWKSRGWLTLGLIVSCYIGVYIFSTIDVRSYVPSSIDRIMLQLLPFWWIGFTGRRAVA